MSEYFPLGWATHPVSEGQYVVIRVDHLSRNGRHWEIGPMLPTAALRLAAQLINAANETLERYGQ